MVPSKDRDGELKEANGARFLVFSVLLQIASAKNPPFGRK